MIIDLGPLLRGEIGKIEISSDIKLDSVPEDYTLPPGAKVTGTVKGTGGYFRLESRVIVPYLGKCARCLDPVKGVLDFSFDRTVVTEGSVDDDTLEENADEYLPVHGGLLDTDEALREAVFLEFPMLVLCGEDCPGLCPKCGRKQKPGERCDCAPPETDPRWDVLKKLDFPD